MNTAEKTEGYKKTVKSSGVLGFSQLIAIALTVVRTKIIALILGTSGYGLFSVYYRLMDFANSSCQMGTGIGGVGLISDAKAKNEYTEVEKLISLLRFWIIFTSSVVFFLVILFSRHISTWQFGDETYSNKLIIIAFAIIFANFYNMHISLLTGLREIKKIAQAQIYSALGGLILAIPFIYFFKKDGIEWSILIVALSNAFVMFLFIRKLKIKNHFLLKKEIKEKLKAISKIGLSYAVPGVLYSLFLYLTNIYLQHKFDIKTVGIYQACMVLSTIYVQTIINAMGTDFLPSLVEKKDDNQLFNQRISQQIELGILIASIGVIATYILAPYVLRLFYSKEFLPGTYILRWQVLAVFLRVMEYPLGFATTAKGKNLFYLILQSIYICFEFGILLLFTQLFGFKGLGFCYLASYSVFLVVRYFSLKHFCGYKFTGLIKKQLLAIAIVLVLIVLTDHFCNNNISLAINSIILFSFALWSYRILTKHMEIYPRQVLNTILLRIKK